MTRAVGRSLPSIRRGVAAVEFAVVMSLVLVPLLIGLWEMGRAVQVQQIVANSAREGARLAAQGRTVNQNGSLTQIIAMLPPAANPTGLPNVKAAVYQSLVGAGLTGLDWDDVNVSFAFTSGAGSNPVNGAKLQPYEVSVSIAYNDKVRWVNLGIVNPTVISYTASWQMLVDDPFTINTTLPPW